MLNIWPSKSLLLQRDYYIGKGGKHTVITCKVWENKVDDTYGIIGKVTEMLYESNQFETNQILFSVEIRFEWDTELGIAQPSRISNIQVKPIKWRTDPDHSRSQIQLLFDATKELLEEFSKKEYAEKGRYQLILFNNDFVRSALKINIDSPDTEEAILPEIMKAIMHGNILF